MLPIEYDLKDRFIGPETVIQLYFAKSIAHHCSIHRGNEDKSMNLSSYIVRIRREWN